MDTDDRPDLVRRYGIVDLPTLMFFTSEGGLVSRMENEFRDTPVERILQAIETARRRGAGIQANLDRWRRKLAAAPDDLEANQRLGTLYYSLKLPEKALPFLHRALELDAKAASEDGAWSYLAAAYLNLQRGDHARARGQAEAFLAALPGHAEVPQMRYYLGTALYHLGEDERARAEWRWIVERHPTTEWAGKSRKALELKPKAE